MTRVYNALDLYDQLVAEQLQTKFTEVDNVKWSYFPPDLTIRMAKEKYGESIFPLYNVFRSEPATPAKDSSMAAYSRSYQLGDNKSMFQLMVNIDYQIDFYSLSLFDMNKANIEYLKFQKSKYLEFPFKDLQLPELTEDVMCEVKFSNNIAVSSVSTMFSIGRYFRYTFNINMDVLVFDINREVPIQTIIFGLYSDEVAPENLLAEYEEDFE